MLTTTILEFKDFEKIAKTTGITTVPPAAPIMNKIHSISNLTKETVIASIAETNILRRPIRRKLKQKALSLNLRGSDEQFQR